MPGYGKKLSAAEQKMKIQKKLSSAAGNIKAGQKLSAAEQKMKKPTTRPKPGGPVKPKPVKRGK